MIDALTQKLRAILKRKHSDRARAVGVFFITSLCARAVGIVCQFLQVPIAIHALGSEAFGLWMTLIGISYVITFADMGVGQGTQNKLAEAFARGSREGQALLASSLLFLTGVGAVLAAAAVVLAPHLPYEALFHLRSPATIAQAVPAVTVCLCVFSANFPLGLAQRLAYARQQGWLHNIAQALGSVGSLLGILVATRGHWSLAATIAATQVPLCAANALLLLGLLGRLGWLNGGLFAFRWAVMRPLLKLGAFFGVQQVLLTFMISIPPIMISAGLGAAAVTPYNLAQRLFNVFAIIQNAFMLPLWPAYSDAKARGEYGWIHRTLGLSIKATALATLLPMALGALAAPWLIPAWVGHTAEVPSVALIWALFAWNAVVFLQQPFGYLLAGLSEVRRLTAYAGFSAVASFVLMDAAVTRFGQTGAVIGLLIGYLPFLVLGNIVEAQRVLRRHRHPAHVETTMLATPLGAESNP